MRLPAIRTHATSRCRLRCVFRQPSRSDTSTETGEVSKTDKLKVWWRSWSGVSRSQTYFVHITCTTQFHNPGTELIRTKSIYPLRPRLISTLITSKKISGQSISSCASMACLQFSTYFENCTTKMESFFGSCLPFCSPKYVTFSNFLRLLKM